MSTIPVSESQLQVLLDPILIERRAKVRFPLELGVRYRTLGRGAHLAGVGSVVNMSRGGILVASQQEIEVGTRIELNIEWPSLLDGRVPLRFVTVGKVVRSDASGFAVMLAQYQFRTAGRPVTQSMPRAAEGAKAPGLKH